MNTDRTSIVKFLSANDVGDTGTHQSGILVPKRNDILSFFPKLSSDRLNPRYQLNFFDESGKKWTFSFIYYNNSFFGGTRNEFRLTRMTDYIRKNNLKAGDSIVFSKNNEGLLMVTNKKQHNLTNSGKIKLSQQWKVVQI